MSEHVWYSAARNKIYFVSPDLHMLAKYLRKYKGKNPAMIYLGVL